MHVYQIKFFLSLTNSHTGEYLAELTAECLKRYGLDKLVKYLFELLSAIANIY
jgi:hypothetical protein